jgi:arachidonate 15-lipoxygenase
MSKLSLPKNAPHPDARAKQLATARDHYRYSWSALPPLATAAEVPKAEGFGTEWGAKLAEKVTLLYLNSQKILGNMKAHPRDEQHAAIHRAVASSGGHSLKAALSAIQNFVLFGVEGEITGRGTRAATLEDFDDLYREFKLPPIARTFGKKHSLFGHLRVAGPNPMQIKGIAALDDRFPVTDAMFQSVMGSGDSLARAGAEGRLYLTDYSALDGVPGSVYPYGQKYPSAPLGLFAIHQGSSDARGLCSVAIQLGQRPGPSTPIFTPHDGWGWKIAKAHLSCADGNVHQVIHHLAHTHLVLEPIVLSTHRQLASEHPVWALLAPHLEGTLAINDAAVNHLIFPKGGVDAVAAARIESVHQLVAESVRSWSFKESMLEADLKRRAVFEYDRLPDYPYRDDALLVHAAIDDWVKSYLAIFYRSAADVQQDVELQAWGTEIASPDGGRIRDFGRGGRFDTVDELREALTHIIFTASAQHAAVNFPQEALMSYAPVMPLATYAPPPSSKEGLGEQQFFELLPPIEMAHYQLTLGQLLGGLHYTWLGEYSLFQRVEGFAERAFGFLRGADSHVEKAVAEAHAGFLQRLAEIEDLIEVRNTARISYEYLLPSNIPQSINI